MQTVHIYTLKELDSQTRAPQSRADGSGLRSWVSLRLALVP